MGVSRILEEAGRRPAHLKAIAWVGHRRRGVKYVHWRKKTARKAQLYI